MGSDAGRAFDDALPDAQTALEAGYPELAVVLEDGRELATTVVLARAGH